MSPKLIELQPNRSLLESDFNGYKLSLETIPTFKQELDIAVDRALPSADQYSFLYAKLYGLHNHLTGETFNGTDIVYYVNKLWQIKKVCCDPYEDSLNESVLVWNIPKNREQTLGDYNVSMKFATDDLAVVGDGIGGLYILKTGCRLDDVPWSCVFSEEVLGLEKCFVVLDVVYIANEHIIQKLHCLLFNIVHEDLCKHPYSIVYWITLTQGIDKAWGLTAIRQVQGKGDVYYAHLEPTCEAVYIASDDSLSFTVDSENPVLETWKSSTVTWSQNNGTVAVKLKLPSNLIESDLLINSTATEVKFKHNEINLLAGRLCHDVDPALTTWSIRNNTLEINLQKLNNELIWPYLLHPESNVGFQNNIIEEIKEKGVHLCTNNESAPSIGTTFNSQKIEECDFEEDKSIVFERLCGVTHDVTHRAHINSHKILLTVKLSEFPPAIALRHDVDACIWQPFGSGDNWTLKHEGTLNAFAYVQASKQQRKFSVCSPTLSYSVVCESSRHLFIYRQQKSVTSGELRHRSTGRKIGTVAQQQVISLTDEEILGIHPTASNLFLLTENCVYVLKL